jgi:PAS domain S-box-containing protein
MDSANNALVTRMRRICAAAAFGGIAIGLLVLTGWLAEAPQLSSFAEGGERTRPRTAVGLGFLGTALLFLRASKNRRQRLVGYALAIVPGLFGLVALFEIMWGAGIPAERWFAQKMFGPMDPKHFVLSPITATSFVFLSASILAIDLVAAKKYLLAQCLALPPLFIALTALAGYLYGAEQAYSAGFHVAMALPSAIGILALSIGALLLRPTRPPFNISTADDPGGFMVRRLIPSTLFVPLAIGWLYLVGLRQGVYELEFGMAMFVASLIIFFGFLIGSAAWRLSDIHQVRARAEREARQRDAEFQALFESTAAGVVLKQIDGTLVRVNRRFCEMLGYTEAELLNKNFLEITHPDDRQRNLDLLGARLEDKSSSLAFEKRYLQKDGSVVWVESAINLIRDKEGQPLYWAVVAVDITARKRADKALQSSRKRLEGIIASAMDAIITVDAEQQIILFNPAAEKMFACPASEALDTDLSRFIPARHRQNHEKPVREFDTTGVTNREMGQLGTLTALRANGEEFPIEGSISQVEVEGMPLYTVILRDITEREKASADLRQRESLFSAVLDALPVGVIIADATGKIIRDNAANRELWGVPPETSSWEQYGEWVGYRPETGERIQAHEWAMARALLKGEVVKGELVECEQFGTRKRRLYLNNSAPVRDHDGNITAGVVVELDVTERLHTEAELSYQRSLLKTITDNAQTGILMMSPEGVGLFANPAAEEITGYSRNELVGRVLHDVIHHTRPDGSHYPIDECPLDRAMPLQADVRSHEDVFVHKSGYLYPVRCNARPIFRDGTPVATVIEIWDITEERNATEAIRRADAADIARREAERARDLIRKQAAELERSNRDLEQFASVASHDLQEPLRAVATSTQLLRRMYGGKLDAEADQLIDGAVGGAERMGTLIKDLLAYSRVGRNDQMHEIDLEITLQMALRNVSQAIRENDAAITHDPLPTVKADATQMTQLLQNLIANAIRYRSKEPPRIHVSVARKDNHWRIGVSDNGIGIEPKYFDRIFGIFQRLHTRREYPGTGIGLAICQKIVERHGGQIGVESTPGQGSTFFFTLTADHT